MEINLNSLGKHLKLNKQGVKPKKVLNEKEMFVSIVGRFEKSWNQSFEIYERFKINLFEYDEQFLITIEDLLLAKYGDWKTDIILWYIYSRVDEKGQIYSLKLINEKDEEEKILLETPAQLWDFILRVEKIKNKEK